MLYEKKSRSILCLGFLSFSLSLLSRLHFSFFLLFLFACYAHHLPSFSIESMRWMRRERERKMDIRRREAVSLFLFFATASDPPFFLPEDVRRMVWEKTQ